MIEPVTAPPASPPAAEDKTASGAGMPLPRDALVKADAELWNPSKGSPESAAHRERGRRRTTPPS